MVTAADHANTVREHERFMWGNATTEEKRESSKEFDAALDALTAQAEEGMNWKASCARYLANRQAAEAERDAAVQAAEQHRAALADEMGLTEQQRARAEAAEQAAEQARAALQQIADGSWMRHAHGGPEAIYDVAEFARAALAGNQP